jgi:serine/threonine protein kinase
MIHPINIANVNFQKIREIGQDGKNSNCFIVRDLQLDAEIVMKEVKKEGIADASQYFDEARLLYLSSHQNVVDILYACEDNEKIYLAMPLYQRGSLKSLMEARYLTTREIVKFSCQVLAGLHNIHSKGLIHFDIKPDNVLLSSRGDALLSDFGLAKQTQLGLAKPNKAYLICAAPEFATPDNIDLRFDIYQVGMLIYRMCCGVDSHRTQLAPKGINNGETLHAAIVSKDYPDRSAFPEHIPEALRKVTKRCLEPNPDDRFQAALDVANALAKVDQCLDWLFSNQGNKTWRRPCDGGEVVFEVDAAGRGDFRTIKAGASRRKNAHCRTGLRRSDIQRILRDEA